MKKERIIIYLFFVTITLLSAFYIYIGYKDDSSEIIETENIKKLINVDIKGAVVNPGVKNIEKGSNVNDLIVLSGGLLENADTSTINLSKKLDDEMVIIIYTKDEINEMKEGNTSVKVIDKECVCPVIENDACVDDSLDFIEIEDNNVNKISLNNATKEQLMTLTGIGSIKADAIIEYRKTNSFKTIDDIMNVKGIGKSTFEKIKDNLTI